MFDGFISGHSYSNTMTQRYLSNHKLTRPKMLEKNIKIECLTAVVFNFYKEHPDRYISQGIHRLMMNLKDPLYFIYNPQVECKH